MTKRVCADTCIGVLVDVQEYFLSHLRTEQQIKIKSGIHRFVNLCKALKIPVVATVERPLKMKGILPEPIRQSVEEYRLSSVLEKDFFDLTKESEIRRRINSL